MWDHVMLGEATWTPHIKIDDSSVPYWAPPPPLCTPPTVLLPSSTGIDRSQGRLCQFCFTNASIHKVIVRIGRIFVSLELLLTWWASERVVCGDRNYLQVCKLLQQVQNIIIIISSCNMGFGSNCIRRNFMWGTRRWIAVLWKWRNHRWALGFRVGWVSGGGGGLVCIAMSSGLLFNLKHYWIESDCGAFLSFWLFLVLELGLLMQVACSGFCGFCSLDFLFGVMVPQNLIIIIICSCTLGSGSNCTKKVLFWGNCSALEVEDSLFGSWVSYGWEVEEVD